MLPVERAHSFKACEVLCWVDYPSGLLEALVVFSFAVYQSAALSLFVDAHVIVPL